MPNFHDAVLVRIVVEWARETSSVDLEFEMFSNGTVHLVVDRASGLSLERTNPWGPDETVATMTLSVVRANSILLSIEMHSGDVITLTGDDVCIA
jgi:methylglyoxal synthase